MRLNLFQDTDKDDGTFIPDDNCEFTQGYFKLIGKERLTRKEVEKLCGEKIELKFEEHKLSATDKLQIKEYGAIWYNSHTQQWCALECADNLKPFSYLSGENIICNRQEYARNRLSTKYHTAFRKKMLTEHELNKLEEISKADLLKQMQELK